MSLSYKLTYKIKEYTAESLVCKIPRKFVQTGFILLGTALAFWIYWKMSDKYTRLSAELKETPIIWDWNLVTNISLAPFPAPCLSNSFMVIIVTSYVGNVDHRTAHRTFTPEVELWKINAMRVFLLGQIPEKEKNTNQSAINEESKTFGDILQGTFIDDYRNLTYKHLMGLKWASIICENASFVLKVDDDTIYNLTRTYAMLNEINNTTDLLLGYPEFKSKVLRNKELKRYVSTDEYPREWYPPYVSGAFYITTPQIAGALYAEALYYPFFWIDDIFVTGILREALGIEITDKLGKYSRNYFRTSNCYCCSEVNIGIKEFDCNRAPT